MLTSKSGDKRAEARSGFGSQRAQAFTSRITMQMRLNILPVGGKAAPD